QLNAERSEETRSFRVVADLTGLDEGTHEVPLEVKNLSSSVTAEIEPKTVTVTIEKKVTQTFTVEPVISTDGATSGYGVDSMSVEPQEVEITTGDKTLAEIDRVVAIVNPDDITGDSITVDGTIEAWDSENNPLAIIPEPDSVDVALMMEAPSKEIELFVTQQGTT
ncbi:CdaR family protein, partial [Proteus terrae]|nr:CdaR family protein [Proteus terrae]